MLICGSSYRQDVGDTRYFELGCEVKGLGHVARVKKEVFKQMR